MSVNTMKRLKMLFLTHTRLLASPSNSFSWAIKQQSEMFSDFAFTLSVHCKRWLEGEKAFDDLPRLIEVIKMERFGEKLNPELRTWLTDRAPKH